MRTTHGVSRGEKVEAVEGKEHSETMASGRGTERDLRRRPVRGGEDIPVVEKEVEISEIAEDEEEEEGYEDDPLVLKGSRAKRPPKTPAEGAEEDWGIEDDDNWGGEAGKSGRPVERQEERIGRIMTRGGVEVAVALLVHLAGLGFYVYVHVVDGTNVKRTGGKGVPGVDIFGGRWKFLTYINLWLQFAFFFLAFLRDIMPDSYVRQLLTKFCDFVFTTLILPLAIFVAVAFWGIYAVDREMIYPSHLEEFNPPILNHFWHTTIVVCVLIELLLVFHRFPTTGNAVTTIFSFSTAYIVWIVVIVSVADYWVYPFLKVMPPPLISVFFAACFFATLGIYFLGQLVGRWRWRERHLLIAELRL